MNEFPDCIPHYRSDPRIENFFRVQLGVEWIHCVGEDVQAVRRKNEYARNLREALEFVIRERPATAEQWARLTQVSFWEEDRLYGYLQDLYDYFYGDRADPPQAPDPEEIPPEKYWK